MKNISDVKIGVVGLGYVGLPLSIEFSKAYPVVGFDIDSSRVNSLRQCNDETLEVSEKELKDSDNIFFSAEISDLSMCNVFVITVPTPINVSNQPDLSPLLNATKMVAEVINKDAVVIYESTVYPGATEDDCVPLLEKFSGMKFNKDFFVGYSPERINPGDKKHRLTDIIKVTSGSTEKTADFVDQLYLKIIRAGTHKAPNIKTAEAAKVIENTQRDLNIALMNELAIVFNKIGINTHDVLEAAKSKWNFLPFSPGLVGGHCIGVDPYYLTHKAQTLGYHPEIILAGRRLNDSMASYIVAQLLKEMIKRDISITGSKILVLGLTFKENCPDVRNTKVLDLVNELKDLNSEVYVHDPWVSKKSIQNFINLNTIDHPKNHEYDAILIAVSHDEYKAMGPKIIRDFGKTKCVVFDIKNIFDKTDSDWQL
tara:strand:- start:1869 stop:3146 length:1278 start_codon:yes stop_codon:yes gene_type:complete